MRAAALLAAGVLVAATHGAYLQEVSQWRAEREASLRAPGGWLSVAGLFWLHEGSNVVGSDPLADVVLPEGASRRAGVLRMQAGAVAFEPVKGAKTALKPDVPGPPDVLNLGALALTVIKRGDRTGVRLKDPGAAARRDFTGCKWFPVSETGRVNAKWVAWTKPKVVPIVNVLGMTSEESAPGYAEFVWQGHKLRLEPITEDDHLFFMFRDSTSGKLTYGAGRFLYAAVPKNGSVELDFNKAENPPCAFTAFATCPLPPKQNVLPVAVEAGEKKYGSH